MPKWNNYLDTDLEDDYYEGDDYQKVQRIPSKPKNLTEDQVKQDNRKFKKHRNVEK